MPEGRKDDLVDLSSVELYCPACDRSFPEPHDVCPNDGIRLTRLTTAKDPLIDAEIDSRFTIQECLGKGGMGAVYRAVQHSVRRSVAIKVIRPRLREDRVANKRFLREAQLASQLIQPSIVTVLDFGQTESGLLYLVMEFVDGITIAEYFKSQGNFTVERAAHIGMQICDALIAAHNKSIIHRDLKPANVMILNDPPGRDLIKVLDFGLAKSLVMDSAEAQITLSDTVIGTPSYISPELALGKTVDARTDLYSLGVLLYEMISGELPFDAKTVDGLLVQHAHRAPKPFGNLFTDDIEAVVSRLLNKQPHNRYANASDVRNALSAVYSDRKASAKHPVQTDLLSTTRPLSQHISTSLELVSSPHQTTLASHPWKRIVLYLPAIVGIVLLGYGIAQRQQSATREPVPVATDSRPNSQKPPPYRSESPMNAGETHPPKHITLTFVSDPAGATVQVDAQDVCTTPCEIQHSSGNYPKHVRMRKQGFVDYYATVHSARDTRVQAQLKVEHKPTVRPRRKKSISRPPADFIDPRTR